MQRDRLEEADGGRRLRRQWTLTPSGGTRTTRRLLLEMDAVLGEGMRRGHASHPTVAAEEAQSVDRVALHFDRVVGKRAVRVGGALLAPSGAQLAAHRGEHSTARTRVLRACESHRA